MYVQIQLYIIRLFHIFSVGSSITKHVGNKLNAQVVVHDSLPHAQPPNNNFGPLEGVGKGKPVWGMGGEEAHGVTLVHGQGHIGQVAQNKDQLLTKDVHTEAIGTSLKPLESLLHREQGFERSEQK